MGVIQHDHTKFLPGCFRCDLSRGEYRLTAVPDPTVEALSEHRICNADHGRVACYCSALTWMTLNEYGEHTEALAARAAAPSVEALSEAQMTALAAAVHQGLHGVNVPAGMTNLNPCIDTTDPAERAAQIEFVTLALRWALDPYGGDAGSILAARSAAPDALRGQLLAWIDDQRQLLPEHRTPAAHAKAELLRDLGALLEDGAQ